MGSMVSLRRLSDATLKRYQNIIDAGGELTPRQQANLRSHTAMVRWSERMDEPKRSTLSGAERAAVAFVEALIERDKPK